MIKDFNFHGDFITLGQMIKVLNLLESGGQIKFFLKEEEVYVNEQREDRRGRKLRADDLVQISSLGTWKMVQDPKQ